MTRVKQTVKLAPPKDLKRENATVVAFIQDASSLRILSAASRDLVPSADAPAPAAPAPVGKPAPAPAGGLTGP